MAAVGSGLERFADVSISTGTVLAALALVDEVSPTHNCYHGPHLDGLHYFRLAFDSFGAGQLDDYQRNVMPDYTIEQLIELAICASREPTGTSDAGASERVHGTAILRLLEKIATSHRGLVQQVAVRKEREIVATGGGARSPFWLQIKANIIGVRIITPSCSERACLGAAAFAAVAAGYFATTDEAFGAMVHAHETYEPHL